MSEAVDLQAVVREYVSAPFHVWLGVKIVRVAAEEVEISMPWRDEFYAQEARTYMHGGVLAAVIDLVADLAIAARIGRALPTVDMRVDYHKAMARGELRATGHVIKAGRTIVTAEARILDAAGNLSCSGRGAYLNAR